jgi:hypothetical protein
VSTRITVKMNTVAIRNMLRSPTGPVGRRIAVKGKEIERLATEKARKHNMQNWVHSTPLPTVLGTSWLVYCDHPASLFVLKGTRPHVIRSHGSWPLRNRKTGEVFGPVVHHPGFAGDPFLTRAMEEAGRL